VLDATAAGVRLRPFSACAAADHLLALRPSLDPGDLAGAIQEAAAQVGKAYDFGFDFRRSDRLVCTELVYRALHGRGGIQFRLHRKLGRYLLTGDDVVRALLAPAEGLPRATVLAVVSRADDGVTRRLDSAAAGPDGTAL